MASESAKQLNFRLRRFLVNVLGWKDLNNIQEKAIPIILDGIIDFNVLNEIKKDYNWIIKILKEKNIELEEVFYAFYTNKKVFVIKKTELL